MIRLNKVSRAWGDDFALHDIDLEINKGEYFVVLGPTGSGKTLLLELLAGFYMPDRGRIEISGNDMTFLQPEER
ncbi:unnamed protein product, partial [marine sediment metagenome]